MIVCPPVALPPPVTMTGTNQQSVLCAGAHKVLLLLTTVPFTTCKFGTVQQC